MLLVVQHERDDLEDLRKHHQPVERTPKFANSEYSSADIKASRYSSDQTRRCITLVLGSSLHPRAVLDRIPSPYSLAQRSPSDLVVSARDSGSDQQLVARCDDS